MSIKDNHNLIEVFVKDLMSVHCVNCSVGSKGSGKSNTMLSVLRACLDNNSFDEYHLVLPSFKFEQNGSYKFILPYKNVKIYNTFHMLIVDRIIARQDKDNSKSILLVIDDATEMASQLWSPDPSLLALVSRSRHLKISTWMLVHSLRKVLSPVLRENLRYLLIYDVSNKKLLDSIYEEFFSVDMTVKEFYEEWKQHKSVRYSCMMLRLGTDRTLYYNFNDLPHIKKYRELNDRKLT